MDKVTFTQNILKIINADGLYDLKEDDDLIQLGILNSFKVTEILMYIEDWTGTELIMEEIDLEAVRTFKALYCLYLANLEKNKEEKE